MSAVRVSRLKRVVACGVVPVVFGGGSPQQAVGGVREVAWCDDRGVLVLSNLPSSLHGRLCSLVGRQVRDGGIGAVVPPPGEAVYASSSSLDGAHQELAIRTTAGGTVNFLSVGDEGTTRTSQSLVSNAFGLAVAVSKTNDANGDGLFVEYEGAPSEGASVAFQVTFANIGNVEAKITALTDTYAGTTIDICLELVGTAMAPWSTLTCHFTLQGYAPHPGTELINTVNVTLAESANSSNTVSAGDTSTVAVLVPGHNCTGCTPPCEDPTYRLMGFKVRKPHVWYFNRSTTPGRLSREDATHAVRQATRNITDSVNDCGLEDLVAIKAPYRGDTKKKANIAYSPLIVRCTRFDGVSVVSFGSLPQGLGGLTCSRVRPDKRVESDILMNSSSPWTVDPNPPCKDEDLEGVLTHERGHSFGLRHVPSPHITLTMFSVGPPCTDASRTLGLGDVNGLRSLY